MKIVLLSGASSVHTVRWANGLHLAGHEVHVITQHSASDPFERGVILHQLPFRGVFGYFTMVPAVRKLLEVIKPDIVNAHYASGYGTTARLVNYHPWMLSVWGTDVYEFPYQSPLHKWLVRKNLMSADAIASTSHAMAVQTRSIAPELVDIAITPFGVNVQDFENAEPLSESNERLIIGTVKTMSAKYGIDVLVESFSILVEELKKTNLELAERVQLRLVGAGSQIEEYKRLAAKLGVADKVFFVGRVPHHEVPNELSKLTIYVALSRFESFGVAVIEAGSAGRPVVVSDAGGLPEVTLNGITGLVVPRENPQAAAAAIKSLVLDPTLRAKMGEAGRKHVASNYGWDVCVETMLNTFEMVIRRQRNG